MAERVVDRLEPVQIQENDRYRAAVAVRQIQRMLEPVGEQRPVGQPGEPVVEGEVMQLGLPLPHRAGQEEVVPQHHVLPDHVLPGEHQEHEDDEEELGDRVVLHGDDQVRGGHHRCPDQREVGHQPGPGRDFRRVAMAPLSAVGSPT